MFLHVNHVVFSQAFDHLWLFGRLFFVRRVPLILV